MRVKVWILIVVLICSVTTAQTAGPVRIVKVAVECSGDDSLGARLCLALKEKIRASRGFELVDQKEAEVSRFALGVDMVSADIEGSNSNEANLNSAAAVVLTLPQRGVSDSYLREFVLVFGASRIDDQAANILAALDKEASFLWQNSN
jgi:hypothetical protein